MTTYWHVAPADYETGEDLLCWDEMIDRGWFTTEDWKWPYADLGHDGNVVSLYRDLDSARDHRAEYDPTGIILRVTIEDADLEASDWASAAVTMTTFEEGFPAVYRRIPARMITIEDL